MAFYGKWETWKVVYTLAPTLENMQRMGGTSQAVAFVEAGDRAHAMSVFQDQYAGQFHTIRSVEPLVKEEE